jgi:hypothetical protein
VGDAVGVACAERPRGEDGRIVVASDAPELPTDFGHGRVAWISWVHSDAHELAL